MSTTNIINFINTVGVLSSVLLIPSFYLLALFDFYPMVVTGVELLLLVPALSLVFFGLKRYDQFDAQEEDIDYELDEGTF